MNIMVVDGQGGKIGKAVVERLLALGCRCEITAIGTNTAATSAMLKAGANMGATGENPVVVNAALADIIVGPIGIIAANSLLGEITPKMALAVSSSGAKKVLIPMNKCNIAVSGVRDMQMSDYIADAAQMVMKMCE